jgi:integrase
MPIYKDGDRYRVRLWRDGRKKDWKLPPGTSKLEAAAFEARKRLEFVAAPLPEERLAPRFLDFCAKRYVPHAESVLAKGTWRTREYQVATLAEHFGDLRLTQISIEAVEAYVARRRKDVGAVRIRDDLKTLRAILGFAQKRHVPVAIPDMREVVRALRVGGQQRQVRAWTQDQVGDLLKACAETSPGILPVVVFLANTGCRKTEAIRLRSKSVDLAAGVIWIEPSEEWRPKSGKARAVPISPALRQWLKLDHEFVFMGPGHARKPGSKKPARPARPWAEWPQLQFDRARKKAGLEGGPHTLRHTYASEFLAAGGSMWELSRILGHSEQRTTALYSHFRPDHVAAAAQRVALAPEIGPAEAAARAAWQAKPSRPTVPQKIQPQRTSKSPGVAGA